MSKRYLIPTLLAAGFGSHDPLQAALIRASSTGTDDPDKSKLFQLFKQDHLYTLAGHRSHSSHSSHSSHRSSTGGYSVPTYRPEPVYTPPVSVPRPVYTPQSVYTPPLRAAEPTEPLLSAPNSSTSTASDKPLPSLSGRTNLFRTIVMHVQVALMGRGLFQGPIDGTVGPTTRAALRQFQGSHGLQATGTITPETLDALHVPSRESN